MSSECLYSQGLDQTGRGIISQYLVPVDQMHLAGVIPALCLPAFVLGFIYVSLLVL